MFDYQNSEDLQELREYIESIQAENKELKNAFNEIEILSKKQIYGCVYGQEGVFNCKLNHSQCDKCLAKEVIKIADKALNKTSL